MKKLSIISALIVCSQMLVAQDFVSKHISNKLTLDYELNWGVVYDGDYQGDDLVDNLKGTKYFNTLNASYKVASRVSISLGYGFHSQKGENSFYRNVALTDETSFSGTELQIGLNLFGKQQRAPLGNHFSIFINRQSIISETADYTYLVGDDFTINTVSIGASFNYVWVVTKKLPIFLKYGVSVSYPISISTTEPTYDINYPALSFGFSPEIMVNDYTFRNIFRANIGLGYAF